MVTSTLSTFISKGRHLTPHLLLYKYIQRDKSPITAFYYSLCLPPSSSPLSFSLVFSTTTTTSSSSSSNSSMETTPEEALGSNMSSDSISNGEFVHAVVKGKRTKRQRNQPPSPEALSAGFADSSSSSSAEAVSGTITEEEEDMANCLILLARGRTAFDSRPRPVEPYREDQTARPAAADKFTSRRLAEHATTADGKTVAGVYVYECKTCNKCFPSFQALGGHRTSHKKPKLAAALVAEEKKLALGVRDDMLQISMNSFSARAIPGGGHGNAKPKVHECSICGSEFSSGQALGGHMRRHRPLAAAAERQETKKNDKSFLSLDLNLPAPADDDLQRPPSSETTFSMATRKRPPLMFSATSASALVVDCHY